ISYSDSYAEIVAGMGSMGAQFPDNQNLFLIKPRRRLLPAIQRVKLSYLRLRTG
ncbi:hypothetical protein J6590_015485, partial [Homalodisca vitripennis]